MLDGNVRISKLEHRALFSMTVFGAGMWLAIILIANLWTEPATESSFGIYSLFDHHEIMGPVYSFAAFITSSIIILRIGKPRLALSSIALGLLAWFFASWFVESQQIIARAHEVSDTSNMIDYNPLLLGANVFDIGTFALVYTLVFWNVSILVRLCAYR